MMDKAKILIVSSNAEDIMQLLSILEDTYDVVESPGGETCIDVATDTSPDLILIDDMIGDPNCYEICQNFKTVPATSEVTLILTSDLSSEELELELNNIQVDDYICKPFNKGDVLEKISTLLSFKQIQ